MRGIIRLIGLVAVLSYGAFEFLIRIGTARGAARLLARKICLQNTSRRLLRVLHVSVKVAGTPPATGLILSNHLSYLDIPVVCSITKAIFVAKSDVKSWPVFGQFASAGGTLFVDRTRRSDVARLGVEIRKVLDEGALLVLFPEGTS